MGTTIDDLPPTLERGPGANDTQVEKPYSIYTKGEKWAIVVMSSVAGIFRYARVTYQACSA